MILCSAGVVRRNLLTLRGPIKLSAARGGCEKQTSCLKAAVLLFTSTRLEEYSPLFCNTSTYCSRKSLSVFVYSEILHVYVFLHPTALTKFS